MRLKTLYSSAKTKGSAKDINAYNEAVNVLLESNPSEYIQNIEYIIRSSSGLSTFKPFIERYGLSLLDYDNIILCLEDALHKCEVYSIPSAQFESTLNTLNNMKSKFSHTISFFESCSDKLDDNYKKYYYERVTPLLNNIDRLYSQYGMAVLPDIIIECVENNTIDKLIEVFEFGNLDAIAYQWIYESLKDFDKSDSLYPLTLERKVNDISNRDRQLFKEAVLTGNLEPKIEYTEDEVKSIVDLMYVKEELMTSVVDNAETIKIYNELCSLYETYGELGEMVADSVVPMLPNAMIKTESLDLKNTSNKKSGKPADYIKRNHDMASYGEDDKDDDKFKRPSAKLKDEEPETDDIDEEDDTEDDIPTEKELKQDIEDAKTPEEKRTAVNNYYYYTYNNSFNKSKSMGDNSTDNSVNNDTINHYHDKNKLHQENAPYDLNLFNDKYMQERTLFPKYKMTDVKYYPLTDDEKKSLVDKLNSYMINIKKELNPIVEKYPIFQFKFGFDLYGKDTIDDSLTVEIGDPDDNHKVIKVQGIQIKEGNLSGISFSSNGMAVYEFEEFMRENHPEECKRFEMGSNALKDYDLREDMEWYEIFWNEKVCGYDKTLREICNEIERILGDKFPEIKELELAGDHDSPPCYKSYLDMDFISDLIPNYDESKIINTKHPHENWVYESTEGFNEASLKNILTVGAAVVGGFIVGLGAVTLLPITIAAIVIAIPISFIIIKQDSKKMTKDIDKLISIISGVDNDKQKPYLIKAKKKLDNLYEENKDEILSKLYKPDVADVEMEDSDPFFTFGFSKDNKKFPNMTDEEKIKRLIISCTAIKGLVNRKKIKEINNELNKIDDDVKFGITETADLPGDDSGGDWSYYTKAGIINGGPDDFPSDVNDYDSTDDYDKAYEEWIKEQSKKIDDSPYRVVEIHAFINAEKFIKDNANLNENVSSNENILDECIQEGFLDRIFGRKSKEDDISKRKEVHNVRYYPLTNEEEETLIDGLTSLLDSVKKELDPIFKKYPIFDLSIGFNEDLEDDLLVFVVDDPNNEGNTMLVSGIKLNSDNTTSICISTGGIDQFLLDDIIKEDYPDEYKRLGEKYDLYSRYDWSEIFWMEPICGYDKSLTEITGNIGDIIKSKFQWIKNWEYWGDNDSEPIFGGDLNIDFLSSIIPNYDESKIIDTTWTWTPKSIDEMDSVEKKMLGINSRKDKSIKESTNYLSDLDDLFIEETGDADDLKPESDHPVKDTFTEIDKRLGRVHGAVKRGVQNVVNAGRVFAKPFKRTSQWIGHMVNQWKDRNENEIKERMADPHARSSLWKAIKTAIIGGSLFRANILLGSIFVFLKLTNGIAGSAKENRIRHETIGELKSELEIVEEKIKDADRANDNKAKYQLMRFKNELNKKLIRVGGTKRVRKMI
jgi:hypothetical protein